MKKSNKKYVSLAVAVMTLLCGMAAFAQEKPAIPAIPDWVNKFNFDSRGFFRYSYEFTKSRGNFNEFNIDRAYVGFNFQVSDKVKVRYLLEGGDLRADAITTTVANNYYTVATKAFYIELQDLLYKSNYLRIGLADLPWVPYEEGLWGYRAQGTIFADRSGYLTSTDLGLAFGGKIPDGYGSWQVNVVNGEGWKRREQNKQKDFHARLTVNPLASMKGPLENLFATGFASVGQYSDFIAVQSVGSQPKDRRIFMLGYKDSNRITLAAEYLWAKDLSNRMSATHPSLGRRANLDSVAKGYSAFGVLGLHTLLDAGGAEHWALLARYDMLDPDTAIDDNGLKRMIGGISYTWDKNFMTLLAYENVKYDSSSAGATTATIAEREKESRIQLVTDFKL